MGGSHLIFFYFFKIKISVRNFYWHHIFIKKKEPFHGANNLKKIERDGQVS